MSKGIVPVLFFAYLCCSAACESVKPDREARFERIAEGAHVITDADLTDEVTVTAACPSSMKHVKGDYCPQIEQTCLRWIDPDNKGINGSVQCAEFAPSKCLSKNKRRIELCIDTYEYPNQRGVKPTRWISWRDTKHACESQGKRLCTRSEWTLACEGVDMKPYPYGDGLHRDSQACNIDKKWRDPSTTSRDDLDQAVPSGSMPNCVSPFGVYDMTGNADESVVNENGRPYASGLMGGHWATGARNRCRPMTDAHNEDFAWYETGGRCCKDMR